MNVNNTKYFYTNIKNDGDKVSIKLKNIFTCENLRKKNEYITAIIDYGQIEWKSNKNSNKDNLIISKNMTIKYKQSDTEKANNKTVDYINAEDDIVSKSDLNGNIENNMKEEEFSNIHDNFLIEAIKKNSTVTLIISNDPIIVVDDNNLKIYYQVRLNNFKCFYLFLIHQINTFKLLL